MYFLHFFQTCWHMCYSWKTVGTKYQWIVVLKSRGEGPNYCLNFFVAWISEWPMYGKQMKIHDTAHFWTKYMLAKFWALIIKLCQKKFWTIHFGNPRRSISISTVHSSFLYIFYEPTGGSPGSSTEEVQPVTVETIVYIARGYLLSYIRHEDFLRPSVVLRPPSGSGYPPWILKRAGLESSGRIASS